VQSPIINRARQDLASQFPEAALVRSVRSGKKVPLLWGWLCSQRQIDAEKLSARPVRLVRSRMAAKAVKLLFKELVHELVYSPKTPLE